jgi:hypothetical protein
MLIAGFGELDRAGFAGFNAAWPSTFQSGTVAAH